MSNEQERPPKFNVGDDQIFIHVVDLYAGTANRHLLTPYFQNRLVRDFLVENVRSARVIPEAAWGLYNLTRRTNLSTEHPLNTNTISDGDVLVFGPSDELSSLALDCGGENRGLPFGEALKRVREFRARTCTPEWVMCEVTDGEYDQMLAAVLDSLPRDERLPDRKLVSDITRSLDLNMSRANVRSGLLDRIHCILEFSQVVSECEARRLVEPGSHGPARPNGRHHRFIGNPAALHLLPASQHETSIISLIKQGKIQIGQVMVY